MDIQSQAVTRSMKEALHPAAHLACRKPFATEVIQDFVVNVVGVRAIPDLPETDLLPVRDAVVGMLQAFRGAAANDGSGDVAKIAGLLRTRKDVHDDRRV